MWYDQVIAINAFVFADCIFVMRYIAAEEVRAYLNVERQSVLTNNLELIRFDDIQPSAVRLTDSVPLNVLAAGRIRNSNHIVKSRLSGQREPESDIGYIHSYK